MKLQEFLNLSPEIVSKLSKEDRENIINDIAPIANRRLRNLRDMPIVSPALSSRLNDDDNIRYFSSEGKNHNKLANEIKELQWFLGAKSSTVSGAKKSAIRVYAKVLGEKQKNVSYDDVVNAFGSDEERRKTFWRAYNKVLESNPYLISTKNNKILGALDSATAQAKIYEEFEKSLFTMDSDDLWLRAKEVLRDEYTPPDSGLSPFRLGSKK